MRAGAGLAALAAALAGCGGFGAPEIEFTFRYPAGLSDPEVAELVAAECTEGRPARIGEARPTATPGILAADFACR